MTSTNRPTRVLGSRRKAVIAATLAFAMIGAFATLTLGLMDGFGLTSTILVDRADLDETIQFNSDRVKFQTKGPTDVRVQKLDFAPGAHSGWHHHPGIVIVAVQSGAVTVWHSDCSSTTYGPGLPAGSVFVEGGDHAVQATSTNGATVYVTYVAPSADPFRTEDNLPFDHCD